MSTTRKWVIGAVLVVVVVMAAGWFLLVGPQRAKAAELRAETVKVHTSSAALRTQLDVLTAQAKLLPAKQAELAQFARQIPSNAALPTTIRELQKAATNAGVRLVSIAPSTPAPFGAPAPQRLVPAAAVPQAGSTAPATPQAAAPTALQTVLWTTQVTGSYVQLQQFVANLEALTRMFLVTSYSMTPSTAAPVGGSAGVCSLAACLLDLNLTGQVFIAPSLAVPTRAGGVAPVMAK